MKTGIYSLQVKDLIKIEALKEVPEMQLKWLIDESAYVSISAGDFLFEPGEELKGISIIIKGRIELYFLQKNNKKVISEMTEGTITGLLPFSRAKMTTGYGECKEPTQILSFPKDKLKELIVNHYELTEALVHVMTSRVRDFTALQQQNEKMMALGKLSAGLAHELNNPASAIVRSSVSLKRHLEVAPDAFREVMALKMEPSEIDAASEMMTQMICSIEKPKLSMMKRASLEDETLDWLDENHVAEVCDMPENFTEFGLSIDHLEDLKKQIKPENLSAILTWMNNSLTTEKMVSDIGEASKRIADLVGSVKNFTHMDNGGDKQFADMTIGIRNTLKMLDHKIKKTGIAIEEDFDETLPPVNAFLGELNQVWTNLIDNATDAMEGVHQPKLIIKTKKDREFVNVSIIDNGPGIPEENQSKIFDPFYTTKEMGKGTGLGLDVVNRIVKQHHGTVKVSSEPGKTEFLVCFPINA
ncbi:MAG: ATP-binding protein [Pelobium sp.]